MKGKEITTEVKVAIIDERTAPKHQTTAMVGTRRLFGKWFSDTERRDTKR